MAGPADACADGRGVLEGALLAAHGAGDVPGLARLYAEAAAVRDAEGDPDGAAFYRTHAYVFALEAGLDEADALHAALRVSGREE